MAALNRLSAIFSPTKPRRQNEFIDQLVNREAVLRPCLTIVPMPSTFCRRWRLCGVQRYGLRLYSSIEVARSFSIGRVIFNVARTARPSCAYAR